MKGVGKGVDAKSYRWFSNRGIKRTQLIVESDNPRAIKFYEELGFEIEGTLRKFYKRKDEDEYIDDYMMSLIV